MEAQTILESVANTADAAAGLARLLGTAEETDVVDTGQRRSAGWMATPSVRTQLWQEHSC